MHEDMVYKGHDWDDMRPHLKVFFQVREVAQARDRRCCLRQQRGDCVPHGERIVFPPETGHVGRSLENHQIVERGRKNAS